MPRYLTDTDRRKCAKGRSRVCHNVDVARNLALAAQPVPSARPTNNSQNDGSATPLEAQQGLLLVER